MKPKVDLAGLSETKLWEYALRFMFGGCVTAATGLVSHRWGPSVGGLFLAFPAILPASLTLVKRHDGRAKAIDDARGASLGAMALITFAAATWRGAEAWPPPLLLALVTLLWIGFSIAGWTLLYGRRK